MHTFIEKKYFWISDSEGFYTIKTNQVGIKRVSQKFIALLSNKGWTFIENYMEWVYTNSYKFTVISWASFKYPNSLICHSYFSLTQPFSFLNPLSHYHLSHSKQHMAARFSICPSTSPNIFAIVQGWVLLRSERILQSLPKYRDINFPDSLPVSGEQNCLLKWGEHL